jgi:hypothetical protein
VVLVSPSAGEAAVRCQYNPRTLVLAVTATAGSEAGIRRVGPEIRVSELFTRTLSCAPVPVTVTNTDQIKVVAKEGSVAWIELRGGPFAPGRTAEEDGFPEIEFTLSGADFAEVMGGPSPDHFQFLKAGGKTGVNLNADEDEDLDVTVVETVPSFFVAFDGGRGDDLIDARGNPGPSMFAAGGPGDDTLAAGRSGAVLDGGSGRDRLVGSPVGDLIAPGRGVDLVKAQSGSDLVELSADRSRDKIDCGAGRDAVGHSEAFDRLRSCEISLPR